MTAQAIEQDLLDGSLDPGARGYCSFQSAVSSATSYVGFGAYAVFTLAAGSGCRRDLIQDRVRSERLMGGASRKLRIL